MSRVFHVSVLTPEHEFFSGNAVSLGVEATDGRMSVLAGHTPVVVSLAQGELEIRMENGETKRAAASDGFMTVTQDETVLMLQSAEWPEDIDRVRAQRAERKAREALLQRQDRQSYLMNQAMLLRAMTRLRVSDKGRVNQ